MSASAAASRGRRRAGWLTAAALAAVLHWFVVAGAAAAAASGYTTSGGAEEVAGSAGGGTGAWRDLADSAGVAEVDRFLAALDEDVRRFTADADWSVSRVAADLSRGEFRFDLAALLRGAGRYLFGELLANTALLGKLVALTVVVAVLQSLQAGFGSEATSRLARMVAFLVLMAIALSGFAVALQTARDVVQRLVSFMQALLPTLLALLVAGGGVASGGLFHPLMTASVTVGASLALNVVLPLVLVSGVIETLGALAPGFRLSGLVSLLRLGALTVLGLTMSAFLGVAAVARAAGGVSDSVALRTGKFLASTFIPVIGKMFADAGELVLGTSSLLAGAVGLAGAAAVLVMVAFPLMKLAAIIITYRLAGAVVQPLDGGEVTDLLTGIANTVAFVFASVAAVGVWFFVSVAIMLGSVTGAGMRG